MRNNRFIAVAAAAWILSACSTNATSVAPAAPPGPATFYVANCGLPCSNTANSSVTAYDALGDLVTLPGGFPGGVGATTVLAFDAFGRAVTLAPGAFGGLKEPGITYVPAN